MTRRLSDDDADFDASDQSRILSFIRGNLDFIASLAVLAGIVGSFLLAMNYPSYGYSAYGVIVRYDSSGYWVNADGAIDAVPVGEQIGNPVYVRSGLCTDQINMLRCQLGNAVEISKYTTLDDEMGWWVITGFVLEIPGVDDVEESVSGGQAEIYV